MVSNLQKLILVIALGLVSIQIQAGEWRKASNWVGMAVVTSNGDNLGQVQDFALDLDTGEINYVVVSVGSFLIKDALIAVSPAALSLASGKLILTSDSVSGARRFGEDSWPSEPDVLAGPAGGNTASADASGATPAEPAGSALPSSGVATISSNRRTATLSADERRIEDVQPTPQGRSPALNVSAGAARSVITRVPNGPLPRFGTLDKDRNGVLNRREIGPWLAQSERYDAVDLDSSGTVDRFEFDIFSAQRK